MIDNENTVMTVRDDIKVLDATLRDGGIVNDFRFSDEFVYDLYQADLKAGVDCMEFGYRADKAKFSEERFGKWKFASDEHIREIVGSNDTEMKISVMADVGRCDYRNDIKDRDVSPVDLIRIATYINSVPEAVEMVRFAHERGYETSLNIMAVSTVKESDLKAALQMIADSPADIAYIVDSYGALYPVQVREMVPLYSVYTNGRLLGIHAHNNQQLGFANTIEAMGAGVSYMDATVLGMGRGAGNCSLENLLGFLKNPKYTMEPILGFIEKHIEELKGDDLPWGYNTYYMLTGLTDQHPRPAIAATKEGKTGLREFYHEMLD